MRAAALVVLPNLWDLAYVPARDHKPNEESNHSLSSLRQQRQCEGSVDLIVHKFRTRRERAGR
jgi:hypothetical protein